MTDRPPLKKCPVCRGRGSLRCDCWPCDCICGWDDEPCEECNGTGWIDPLDDLDWMYEPIPPQEPLP
jgi:hypothetical protein